MDLDRLLSINKTSVQTWKEPTRHMTHIHLSISDADLASGNGDAMLLLSKKFVRDLVEMITPELRGRDALN